MAVATNPRHIEAYRNLGVLLKELGRLDDAAQFEQHAASGRIIQAGTANGLPRSPATPYHPQIVPAINLVPRSVLM